MRIRDYAAGDRDGCLAVFDGNVPRFFTPMERADFAAFLDALPGPYLVLEDVDGTVVGCGGHATEPDGSGTDDAAGTPHAPGTVAVLCWGMVRHERHGTGLGRALLEARLDRIRDGAAAIDAVIIHTSQHTRDFYARRGFVLERVTPDAYGPGLDRCDMRLAVPPGAGGTARAQ